MKEQKVKPDNTPVPVPAPGPLFCRLIRRLSGFSATAWLLPFFLFFYTGHLFLSIGIIFLYSSFFSMLFYGTDKQLAAGNFRRIPEANLLLWDLFWGWPGGLCARHLFRHKTVKISYRIFFWLVLLLNLCLTFGLIYFRNELHEFRNIFIK